MISCKIKSIKKKWKNVPVYDIVGLKNHNFVVENVVAHNCDESIRFASSQDWAKRENRELKKKLAQVRTKHLFYILCFPLKIYKLEKTYLESFVNYWCVTGDTKILIKDKNNMIRNFSIKDLRFKKNYKVATYNIQENKIEYFKPEDCIKTRKNEIVYEIELENGIKIKATEDHEFLTKNNIYKKLKDLNEDDELVVKNKLKFIYSKIKKITKLKEKEDVYDIIGAPKNHNFIANNIVTHNCDLFGRGQGAIYVKDRNPVKDSWAMKQFEKIGAYTEFTNISKIEKKLKRHPNFWQIIKFPKPPEWLYTAYLNVREKNIYDDENILVNVTKQDIYNALLILTLRDIMMHDTTLTMNRIILHIKNEMDISIPKQVIQSTIEDSKQLIAKVKEGKLMV